MHLIVILNVLHAVWGYENRTDKLVAFIERHKHNLTMEALPRSGAQCLSLAVRYCMETTVASLAFE